MKLRTKVILRAFSKSRCKNKGWCESMVVDRIIKKIYLKYVGLETQIILYKLIKTGKNNFVSCSLDLLFELRRIEFQRWNRNDQMRNDPKIFFIESSLPRDGSGVRVTILVMFWTPAFIDRFVTIHILLLIHKHMDRSYRVA